MPENEVGPETGGVVRAQAGERLEQAAEAIHGAARRIADKGGAAARVAPAAHRVGSGFENAAEYVRARDAVEMRRDVEATVRANPLRSLAVAVVAGYFVGRILR